MSRYVVTYLSWLLLAITIWKTVLTGNKYLSAWVIALVGQAGRLAWIAAASAQSCRFHPNVSRSAIGRQRCVRPNASGCATAGPHAVRSVAAG